MHEKKAPQGQPLKLTTTKQENEQKMYTNNFAIKTRNQLQL